MKPKQQTPVVALRRARCPRCRSVDCRTTRTLESEAEILSQRKKCRQCGTTFIAIYD